MNETLRLINERTSLRTCADRPIDREDADRVIESAMRAPTVGNMMLKTILEVADSARKARLAETCGHAFIADAPAT
ncbi:MAG: nitroreductase family protein [Candidatus Bipolaricaulota bacterium]|nr:nitroreductase family protein [Candidatus Bipolaricaulota bacterium]